MAAKNSEIRMVGAIIKKTPALKNLSQPLKSCFNSIAENYWTAVQWSYENHA